MRSIKIKMALIFIGFMVSLVLCGIILNILFLERYYIYKNKKVFIDTSKKISDEYIRNSKSITNFIGLIDRSEGINCIITDGYKNDKYNSFPQKSEPDSMKLPKEIEQLVQQNENKLSNTYVYSVIEKTYDQTAKLAFISKMDSGELIVLRKPLKGISESVSIANQFYLYAGLVIVLVGGIFIFTFSKTITGPVIEMSNVAESISNLDFSKRVIYDSHDEIGSLGKSLNKMSEKLSAGMNALTEDVERRKQLVRNISHELKTPIGVIKGYSEGLKFGLAEDKEKIQKYCTVIAEECDRMDGLVKELLNLSLLESGMFQLSKTEFVIGDLIKKILNRFETVFIEKEITINLNGQLDSIITADYDLLERALNNFIINAVNYADDKKLIKVSAESSEKRTRVSVFNTGKNLSEEEMSNVWYVFYKADKARSRQKVGHGLGLSIVKLIAELHGGYTGIENVPEGITFFIDIPH